MLVCEFTLFKFMVKNGVYIVDEGEGQTSDIRSIIEH